MTTWYMRCNKGFEVRHGKGEQRVTGHNFI